MLCFGKGGSHQLSGRMLYRLLAIFIMPPLSGGLDLDSRSSGCARLGGGVAPPFGVVVEEVAVLVVLVIFIQPCSE